MTRAHELFTMTPPTTRRRNRNPFLLAAVSLCAATSAPAETKLTGYYMADVLHNSRGGIATGTDYISDAGVMLRTNALSLFRGQEGTLFAYLLWNNGSTFSARNVGDFQVVSSIDGPSEVRIFELWYEQSFGDSVSARVGLYDVNSEFDAIATAGLFVHASQGMGAEFAQSGVAGPSTFPATSLAARIELAAGQSGTLRYALLDGVPGDPDDPGSTTIDLGGDDGALHVLEYNYAADSGTRYGVGGWLYSADFALIEPGDTQARDDGNAGAYAFVDAPLYRADDGTALDGYVRYGVANEDLNPLDRYVGAGIVATGLVPGRPDDQAGFAIAHARFGSPARRVRGDAERHETTLELTYSAQVTDWLRLQPDIQYVINPGGRPDLGNALVVGLRFELRRALSFAAHHR